MRVTVLVATCLALAAVPARASVKVEANYETASIYWDTSDDNAAGLAYGEVSIPVTGGGSKWVPMLHFVYLPAIDAYAGSVFGLLPNTAYDVRLYHDSTGADPVLTETSTISTRSDSFPVGSVKTIATGLQSSPVTINHVHGTPTAYVLYVPSDSNALDGSAVVNNIVIRDSSYVIIRGFKLTNAQESPIRMDGAQSQSNIVIDNNEITGWGRVGSEGFARRDHGIYLVNDAVYDYVTIQNNNIHDPRGVTNSWDQFRSDASSKNCTAGPPPRCHPEGPFGIRLSSNNSKGHVIRNNTVDAGAAHYWEDAIGTGGLNINETDIHNNNVVHVWDDALEMDGSARNIRVWDNYIDFVRNGASFSPIGEGPAYFIRNVINRTQADSGAGFKTGHGIKHRDVTGADKGIGWLFFLHNTIWSGPDNDGGVYDGISGNCLTHVYARNNVIQAERFAYRSIACPGSATSDIDFDLWTAGTSYVKNVPATSIGPHGINAAATYESSTSQFLRAGTSGYNDGQTILPFNYFGGPDRGAKDH